MSSLWTSTMRHAGVITPRAVSLPTGLGFVSIIVTLELIIPHPGTLPDEECDSMCPSQPFSPLGDPLGATLASRMGLSHPPTCEPVAKTEPWSAASSSAPELHLPPSELGPLARGTASFRHIHREPQNTLSHVRTGSSSQLALAGGTAPLGESLSFQKKKKMVFMDMKVKD